MYPTNLGVPGIYISSVASILNPELDNSPLISLVRWHPSPKIFHKGSMDLWNLLTLTSGDLECSVKINLPSFFSTLLISLKAISGLGIEHKVYVQTTESIEFVLIGISSALAVKNSKFN